MIKSLKIENPQGESILCEFAKPWDTGFLLTEIEGMGPVKSTIQTTDISSGNGSRYNSARIDERDITVHIMFYETDEFVSIEELRHKTYQYFPCKQKVKLIMTTDERVLWIEGYVEDNDPDIWSKREDTKISIVCPDPFFRDLTDTKLIFNGVEPLFEFPFHSDFYEEYTSLFSFEFESGEDTYQLLASDDSVIDYDSKKSQLKALTNDVYVDFHQLKDRTGTVVMKLVEAGSSIEFGNWNDPDDYHFLEFGSINRYTTISMNYTGDEPTGVTLHFHALGNDLTDIRFYNETYRQIFKIDTDQIELIMRMATATEDDDPETFYGFQTGDDIIINTDEGYKSAYLLRGGVYYNILNAVAALDNDWITIYKGRNRLTYTTAGTMENLEFTLSYNNKYWGI